MEKFSFEIETDNTDEVLGELDEAIDRALEAMGMQVENYAKENCPVDTGLLRNSITHVVASDEKAVYVGSNVEYAAYQELGTFDHKIGHSPYLRPAVMDHVDELQSLAKDAIAGFQ